MNAWTLRRTQWGYSLFYAGELVASADRWADLLMPGLVGAQG